MAMMMDPKGNVWQGEDTVYDCIEAHLPKDVVAYHNREVSGLEFDFCLLIKNIGLVVLEVKGWAKQHITKVVSPDEIYTTLYAEPVKSPKKQARAYRFALRNCLNNRCGFNPLVLDMVCYPFLSEQDYKALGLHVVSDADTTLFAEDLHDPKRFSQKILNAHRQMSHTHCDKMNTQNYDKVRRFFEVGYTASEEGEGAVYSQARIFPHTLTSAQADDIVKSYFSGIKQIVFVSSPDALGLLKRNLQEAFNAANIACGKQFVLKANPRNVLSSSATHFGVFNFECFCVEHLAQAVSEDTVVVNGDPRQMTLMETLATMSGFNVQQYAVEHARCDRDIQVRAGAGTGKTFSMISRISYICHAASHAGVTDPAREIAMLTFTTDAAINMKTRLKTQFMNYFMLTKDARYLTLVDSIERMRISTIHSFVNEIMKATALPLGIGSEFSTIAGHYRRRQVFHRVFNDYLKEINQEDESWLFGLPISMYDFEKKLMEIAPLLYNKGFDIKAAAMEVFGTPVGVIPDFTQWLEKVVKQTEIEYARELQEDNCVSLQEYMLYMKRCVEDDSFNTNLYAFRYLFIDEFQDVDDSQIESFLTMQKKLGFRFFIVGDLKQSIYRFRGATMDAFTNMGCEDASWLRFGLNTNYRSDCRLLDEFAQVFSSMGKERLIPYRDEDDSLKGVRKTEPCEDGASLCECIGYTKEEEQNGEFYDKLFAWVQDRVTVLQERNAVAKLNEAEKTVAILVRTNTEAASVLAAAKQRGVAVEGDTGGELYRLPCTRDLCKLTAALTHPYSAVHLFDLICSNNVNVAFSAENLAKRSDREKLEVLVDCLDNYYGATMGLTWAELIYRAQTCPPLMVLRELYEATKPWKAHATSVKAQAHYRTNYELLFETIVRSNRRTYLTLNALHEALYIGVSTGQEARARDVAQEDRDVRVVCTTVHKSKGLEYDSVVLPFTNKRLDGIPANVMDFVVVGGNVGYMMDLGGSPVTNEYYESETEVLETMRDESRILYVALTRAINKFVWMSRDSRFGTTWGTLLEEVDVCR